MPSSPAPKAPTACPSCTPARSLPYRDAGELIATVLATRTLEVPAPSQAFALSNALRVGLREQGTRVIGVHVGFVDTDATGTLDVAKVSAAEVAEKTMDGIIGDDPEVLGDEAARRVRAALSGPLDRLYPAS